MTKKDRVQIVENAINEYLAALWYVGGMISGALVMVAFLNS